MVEHLAGEVTDEVYRLSTSWQNWRRDRWKALVQADMTIWRELGHLRQAATELAFKMHRVVRRGQDPKTHREIEGYRQRPAELGATPPSQDSGLKTSEPADQHTHPLTTQF